MAAKLAAGGEGLILGALVLGVDVCAKLVEFFDRSVDRRGGCVQDELGLVDILLDARAVSNVLLIEGGELLVRSRLARVFRLDALMRRYDHGRGNGRGLGVSTGGDGKRSSERRGKEQAADHRGPRGPKAKDPF